MNRSCCVVTDDSQIDIVLKSYKNRDLLIATHLSKLGPLLLVTRDYFVNVDDSVFNVRTFFGDSSAEIQAAARYLAKEIDIEKPLLISLALKDYEAKTLKSVAAIVNNLKLQTEQPTK